MKRLWAIFSGILLSTSAFALDAPYLIEVVGQGNTSVTLSWRNNSTAYTGILVLRKTDGSDVFDAVTETAGSESSYLDTALLSGTLYTYALIAIAGTDTSDTSNTLKITLTRECDSSLYDWQDGTDFLTRSNLYWIDSSAKLQVSYRDIICDEDGLIIFRREGDSTIYTAIDTIFHEDPYDKSTRIWFDTTCKPNRIYQYRFAMFKDTQLVWQEGEKTFTYNPEDFFIKDHDCISTVEKIGEIPVYFSLPESWIMLKGDTLLVKESNTDSSVYTLIDISDPADPSFIGIHDSGPVVTAGSSCFVDGERVFVFSEFEETENSSTRLSYYSYGQNGFELLDTLEGSVGEVIGKIDDSTIVTGFDYLRAISFDTSQFTSAYSAVSIPQRTVSSGFRTTTTTYYLIGMVEGMLFFRKTTHVYMNDDLEYQIYHFKGNQYEPFRDVVQWFPVNFFPIMIDGYIAIDPVLTSAEQVVLDTQKTHAYVFGTDKTLRIYSYRLDPATMEDLSVGIVNSDQLKETEPPGKTHPLISDYRHLSYPVYATIFDVSGRVAFRGMVGSRDVFRKIAGKLHPGIYVVRVTGTGNASTDGAVLTLYNVHP
ncbi:MAG: fibronectin type III domain-containing protein [Chitinispirillaceae bacterium]|nr:fibronectin type III domain-containing protein [Chitinispirillaceae bacterium]